jgi:uncharacterized membrane protein YiaA
MDQKPSNAFIGASWAALIIGFVGYNIGLWNAQMALNEKGYYFTVLLLVYLRPYRYKKAYATVWKASRLQVFIMA